LHRKRSDLYGHHERSGLEGGRRALPGAAARPPPPQPPRLSLRLRDLLPDDDWNTVEKYEDAAAQLHSMELEAAFQAAFSLARELP